MAHFDAQGLAEQIMNIRNGGGGGGGASRRGAGAWGRRSPVALRRMGGFANSFGGHGGLGGMPSAAGGARAVKTLSEFMSTNSMNIGKYGGGALAVVGGLNAYKSIRDRHMARTALWGGAAGLGIALMRQPDMISHAANAMLGNRATLNAATMAVRKWGAFRKALNFTSRVAK